eukprot:6182491-Amphidinium_carterae.1
MRSRTTIPESIISLGWTWKDRGLTKPIRYPSCKRNHSKPDNNKTINPINMCFPECSQDARRRVQEALTIDCTVQKGLRRILSEYLTQANLR